MPSPAPSWSIPTAPRTPRPALNAFAAQILETDPAGETPEERTTRHLRLCQELLERGMRLARIASDRAEQDMQAPAPSPMPGSSAAALEQSEARARRRNDYAMIFARLSRAVRQTIALQAHIAAGRPFMRVTEPPNANHRPGTNPRVPNRNECRLDAADPPDWALPASPNGQIEVEVLLQSIDRALGDEPSATPAPCKTGPVAPAPHLVRPEATRPADAPIRPARRW